MKKTLLLILTLMITLLTVSGCSTNKEEKDLLEVIKDRGYIIVGTEGTYKPNSYHDENDKLVGFDVEVAKLIADYLGVEVQYYETEWKSIFAALDSGRIDIIVNECGYTDERAEKYDFSNPYSYVQGAILTRNDDNSINSINDLKGKVAANEATSTLGALALEYGATLDAVNEMSQSIMEVVNGRADCTLNYVTAFVSYLNEQPNAPVKIAAYMEAQPTSYVPVVKGNEKLVQAINEALADGLQSGRLKEISEKYFGVDVTKAN